MRPQNHSTVIDYITTRTLSPRHATLIDPANQSPEVAANRALTTIDAGSKLIMVGGSTKTPDEQVHATVQAIQEALELRIWAESQDANAESGIDWNIPVILFPCGAHALSPDADAITFMMLMNSESREFLVGEQHRGATRIAEFAIETLPTGYLVCAPGGEVGQVGKATLIQASDIEGVMGWAHCAVMFGFKLFYLEAGSGADVPVSPELIASAAAVSGLTIFVGGGISDGDAAHAAVEAGANWIVTGTLTENCHDLADLRDKLSDLITTMTQSSS
jgi:phosphoglycerol geranylgeranyltransferase